MVKYKRFNVRKFGFTLVELLAIITILGVIALIVIPTVQEVINESRRKSFLNSANGIIRAADLYYSKKEMLGEKLENTIFEFPDDISDLKIQGNIPKGGMVKISHDGVIELAVNNGKYCAKKTKDDIEIVLTDNLEECFIPYEEFILNGADPVLKTGMIPVTIEADGTVRKAREYTEWYNYENKIWANAITVKEENRQKYEDMKAGEVIPEEDILTYFVWIPRYKYKLWYVEAANGGGSGVDSSKIHSIDIVFENKGTDKSDGTCGTNETATNGCYLTHPAFTFGEEVNGIWVGKFETGYSGITSASKAIVDNIRPERVIIKPSTITSNIYTWRYNPVSNMFFTAQRMTDSENIFGLAKDSDTHMMKNTEWGAVAYLSHSEYGTCTDGICTEVYINNNSEFVPGCGGDAAFEESVDICKNQYGTKTDGVYNQSTTKNISGIFDMSGGAWEMVMGYTTAATTKYGTSKFDDTTFPEDKYVDIYSSTNNLQYSDRILGDATGEMGPYKAGISSWYDDYARFNHSGFPWFMRGGVQSDASSGIFCFHANPGSRQLDKTFRIVLV